MFKAAEVEVGCLDLVAALDVLAGIGFRVAMVMPADDPQVAVIEGLGTRIRLVRGETFGAIRIVSDEQRAPISAGGLRIELVVEPAAVTLPKLQPAFVVTRNDPAAWRVGRANMQYRDLIPDRQGGRFIASHIRVPEGGPVPDYVHHHAIRFQMIYCYRGSVRLVYEDQGEPFTLTPGDCVMQPPGIRHRVLECSPGLEVIEVGTPAVHATHGDHDFALPNPIVDVDRDFAGQRFLLHRAGDAGFAAASLGIATASAGVASARVLHHATTPACTHDAELVFGFVLRGELAVTCSGETHRLATADAFAIPQAQPFELAGSDDLALLEVTLPAQVTYTRVR